MLKRCASALFSWLLICAVGARPVLPQTTVPDPQVETVKRQVRQFGVAQNVTVVMRTGQEYYGAITRIEGDHFEVAEVDLKQVVSVPFDEVKKVRPGYGRLNHLRGKRVNPQTSLLVGLGIVGGLIGIAWWSASQTR